VHAWMVVAVHASVLNRHAVMALRSCSCCGFWVVSDRLQPSRPVRTLRRRPGEAGQAMTGLRFGGSGSLAASLCDCVAVFCSLRIIR
jgi:hypothetical protein